MLSISCDENEGERVKMHDLVRDVALRIANNESKVIKCALERDVDLKCTSIRYLWCRKFPNDLDCSSIEFLCIKTDLDISNGIFEGMVRLRVLFLSWEGIGRRQLSFMSFKLLTNLRCLSLECWDLADISFAGHMKKLESLTLHLCSFFELPDVVVAQLKNLRLLHLSKCNMKKNPFEVIGRHPLVEELYFYEWGFDNGDHSEFFKKFSVPQALTRYQIKLGPGFEDCEEEILNAHRTLILSCFDTSNAVVVDLAEKAEVLLVANIKGGGKNIIPDIFQIEKGAVMNYRWIELWLCDSESIVCLVDTRNHSQEVRTLLFELRKLRIERMENLGALYHGVLPNGLFEKLEQLYIYKCPLLTCLFIPAVARNLVHLEKLEIVSCDGLKHVVEDDGTEDEEISRHDDLLIFSKLKQLHISGCLMLEYTIPVTFAEGLVELESLEIYECYEMKYVFGQRTHGGQGQRRTPKIELPALEKLRLTSNSNMISIFPECCCTLWPSLHEFYLWDCPEFDIDVNTFDASRWEGVRDVDLEKHSITSETLVIYNSNAESIFNLDGLQTIGQPINLRLQYLRLSYLYQMKYICVGMKNTFTFRNLKTLEIYGCQKVEVIFPTSVLRCLPELERLEITECQELKQIIEDDDDLENERFSNFVSTAQPCFPKLVALVVNDCHNLERLFCVSVSNDLPNLELLIIWGATKLEELIGYGQGQGSVDQMQKVKVELPKLKLLVLTYLSSLNQEIELPTVTLCVVHNCTKLSLTSSFATLLEFEGKLSELEKDLEVDEFYRWKLLKMVGENIIKSNQVIISGVTRVDENTTDEDATARFPVGPKDQASCSKVCTTLSFDIEGGLGKKFDGDVTYSHIPTVIETSSAELNERPSTNHLDFTTLHNNAHSHREVEEKATSFNAGLLTLSTHSKSDRQRPNLLFNSQGKSYKHTKIRLCQTEIYIDKQSEGHPINLKASEDDDDATEDNIVVKVISELEETLKLPLKDIASSEATILRLLTALKFLSQLPLEDVTLSSGLKAVIESLHHQFPSILCSFKQAFFAASHNPANEVAGKAELSSLHENVRRDKFKMMEDSRKARQQLFEVNYKWSALCSQFELNLIAARTP